MTNATASSSWLEWPAIRALLAALLVRVGTPLRLAIRHFTHDEARDLSRQIRQIEDAVRQRLAGLIAELLAMPAVLSGLRLSPQRKPQPKPQGGSATISFDPREPRTCDKPPAFRYLPRTPSSQRTTEPSATPPRERTPHPQSDYVYGLSLGTRLAAVAHVIDQPRNAAIDILRRNPRLAEPAYQQWQAAGAPTSPPPKPSATPVNRRQRRQQKHQKPPRPMAGFRAHPTRKPDTS